MIRSTPISSESPTSGGRNLAAIVSALLACVATGLLVYWFWRRVLAVPLMFPGGIHLEDGPTSLRPWAPWWVPVSVMVAMTLLVWRTLVVRRGTVSLVGAPFAMIALAPMAVFIGALSLQLGILMQLTYLPSAEKIMKFAAGGLAESATLFVLNLDFVVLVLGPIAILGLLSAAFGRIAARSALSIGGHKQQRQIMTQGRAPSLSLTRATFGRRVNVDGMPIVRSEVAEPLRLSRPALVAGCVLGLVLMIAGSFWVADASYLNTRSDQRNDAKRVVRFRTDDAIAQYKLGLIYAKGQGVAQNPAEAVKWLRFAADQGHALAQANLGIAYERGQGVAQDYAESAKWYRKAAEQGNAVAQAKLGIAYENGRGVVRDYAEAANWYRKAAEQDNAAGQANLGFAYEKGRGVTQDYAEAINWYRKASEQGEPTGQNNLGAMYARGTGVTQDYAEAIKWFRMAADQGNVMAQVNLGNRYANGRGVPQDYVEAAKWYRKAAEQGSSLAQAKLRSIPAEAQK